MDLDEEPATIDDFFSDEGQDSSVSSDEDDVDDIMSASGAAKGILRTVVGTMTRKKRKKKTVGPSSALPSADLTPAEFRKRGKELIDFIADYLEGSRDRPVNHSAIQGYLFRKMPKLPPSHPVNMDEVYKEIKQYIFPGLPQWQSPKHHALLPAGGSYASLLGSMLCDGLGCIGFTWADCPAATELEMLVMNWLAHLMDLPIDFHFFGKGSTGSGGGGGIIQTSTTEALLTVMTAAKRKMLGILSQAYPDEVEWELQDKFMVYCSEQAHPSLERVSEIAGVRLKRLWTDREGIMHADTLRFSIDKDRVKGYFPIMWTRRPAASPRSGSTSSRAMRAARSFVGSTSHCCMGSMVKKVSNLTHTFACEDPDGPLYIPPDDKNIMADYRSWSLPMTRRFRAMKMWVVIKLYGVKGLQQKIREDVRRAKELEKLIGEDHRFEIMGDVMFGVIAFRCKRPDNNKINHEILKQINKTAVIKMTGARIGFKFWLRFVVSGRYTDSEDVKFSWDMIRRTTNKVIADHTERQHNDDRSGMPNYKYVMMIGAESAMEEEVALEDAQAETDKVDLDSVNSDKSRVK